MSIKRSGRPTIADVAALAGVSRSAVSKVLNNSYGLSADMRERVEAAIEELSYRPQSGARAMRGRTYTVGVVLADRSSAFAALVVEGMETEFEGTPFKIVIGPGGTSSERQIASIEALVDLRVDGLVLLTPSLPNRTLERLAQEIPCVAIGRHGRPNHFDSVVDDDALGASLVVEHLVGLGHHRIGHIAHDIGALRRPSVLAHTVRADSFIASMQLHGLEPNLVTTAYTEKGGYDGAQQLLSAPNPPTAIFAGADVAAFGVLRYAVEHQIDVPSELSVVGYDNVEASSITQVSLTTVDQYPRLSGQMCARLLIERIDGRTAAMTHTIAPRLVVRSSTAPPRTA